jgi:hypothetical protein
MERSTPRRPSEKLDGFKDFDAFLAVTRKMFTLTPAEYRGMYQVLLKLQSIGQDPTETLQTWKNDTCGEDCPEFIRFMIQIDTMDMETLKEMA